MVKIWFIEIVEKWIFQNVFAAGVHDLREAK